jgi:hypothetical protein
LEFVKFILLVPLKYNDGRKVPVKVVNGIRDDLFTLADGYSLARRIRGAYRMKDGSRKNDETLCYWLVVTEDRVPALKSTVADICRLLKQEAMYLERVESEVEFILPSSPNSGGDEHEEENDGR